ncbi:MAG: hypothetical protein CSA33_04725 [Desulfobulbus propionicus]|nr:MAG: hypothetical protein CSA33_04725 [Desulfobulbus propionicus]
MAAKIEQALGDAPKLIPGSQGVFEVMVDGELVYSKFKTGSFPDEDQLTSLLAAKYGGK